MLSCYSKQFLYNKPSKGSRTKSLLFSFFLFSIFLINCNVRFAGRRGERGGKEREMGDKKEGKR